MPNRNLTFANFAVALMLIIAAVITGPARGAPQTQPAPNTDPAARRGEMLLGRVRDIVDGLSLTDDQKSKVGEVFQQAREDAQNLAEELRGLGPRDRGQRFAEFLGDVRGKLNTVLTPEQQQRLDEQLRELRGQVQPNAAGAATGPTTAPAGEPAAGQGAAAERLRMLVTKFEEAVQKLELTPEQKTQADAAFNDMRARFQELRRNAPIDMRERAQQSRQIFQDTREKLRTILTPEQAAKLREQMQEVLRSVGGPTTHPVDGPGAGGPGERGRGRGLRGRASGAGAGAGDDPQMQAKTNEQDPSMNSTQMSDASGAKRGRASGDSNESGATAPAPVLLAVGQPAPDFSLEKLDGRPMQLSSMRGKLVVLVFGSYSSPSFRQRAGTLEDLVHQEGTHANVLVIYTREAHPAGGWDVDRNRDEHISVAAHKDLAARKLAARNARESLKLTNVAFVLDDLQDSTLKAYGARENSAVLVGRDGTILARQEWFDPFRMKHSIEEAMATKPTTQSTVR